MAGRKKLSDNEKMVPINIFVKPEVLAEMEEFVKANNLKFTDVSRDFLIFGFKLRKVQKSFEPALKTAKEELEDKMLSDALAKINKGE